MNFLLINAYSTKNRGDAGIVVAMIYLIREVYPDAKIKVMSSYWEENKEFYNRYKVESVPAIWTLNPNYSTIGRYLSGIKKFFKSLLFPNKIEEYKNADVVISVGGGYLYSSRKGPLGVGLINALFHIWLGKRMKKKTLAFPQSVGPINYFFDKIVTRLVLKEVDSFISRESITTELLKKMNIKSNLKQIPDIGFTLPKKVLKSRDVSFDKGSVKVGLTLLDWRFAKKNSTSEDIDLYLSKVAYACEKIYSQIPNVHFYIFPQVTVGEGDSDMTVSKRLEDILGSKSTVINLDLIENCPEYLVDIYGRMDMFIGSRMHSTIFALAGGTPTIALAYQYKTMGTFKEIGLDNYVLNVEDFDQEDLSVMMSKIITNGYPLDDVEKNILHIKRNLINEINSI